MFKVAGVLMVENCIAGYNSCMFAYGQVSYRFHLLLQIIISLVVTDCASFSVYLSTLGICFF